MIKCKKCGNEMKSTGECVCYTTYPQSYGYGYECINCKTKDIIKGKDVESIKEKENSNMNSFEFEILRNKEWYKLKPLLESLGISVTDLGNDSAMVTYKVSK